MGQAAIVRRDTLKKFYLAGPEWFNGPAKEFGSKYGGCFQRILLGYPILNFQPPRWTGKFAIDRDYF